MSKFTIDEALWERIRLIVDSPQVDFSELVIKADLDPASDFRYADLSGIDFGSADLSGYDFTGADLSGADLSASKLEGCILKDANLVDTRLPFLEPRRIRSEDLQQIKVFINYSYSDLGEAALARIIANRLKEHGCTIFIDQDLSLGQDWNTAIERALDVCDVYCTLLSPTSVKSPIVQNEIAHAGARHRRDGRPELWPIRCRLEGELPNNIGSPLRRVQHATWAGEADTALLLDLLLYRLRVLRAGLVQELTPTLCTLPRRVDDFAGREAELERLCSVLINRERRVCISAIGGMGGVGKTSLAVEAAWRVAGAFPDGVLFVTLRGFDSAEPLTPAEAVAAVIGQLEPTAKLPDQLDRLQALYRRLLTGRRLLLLLDDARDLAQVEPLIPPEPVAVLLTSRHQILLPGAVQLNLDVMHPDEAKALLRGIIGPARATDAQLALLAERCGRLPLALRAAGTYLKARRGMKVETYLDLLAKEKESLKHLAWLPAKLDVQATLGLSVAAVEREDAALAARWRRLAVFPAGFLPDAAAAVWAIDEAEAGAALDGLVARALLSFEPAGGRYRLHDLVRDLAAERLDAAERKEAESRHAEHYYKVLAQAQNLFLQGHDGVLAGLALFDQDRANIEAGQAWAARHWQTRDNAGRLAYGYTNAVIYLLDLRLSLQQRIAWLETAAAACRRLGNHRGEGLMLSSLGIIRAELGEITKAIVLYEQALVLAREVGDRYGEGNALGNLGNAFADLGETRKAIAYHEQYLAIVREIGDRRGEGNALGSLGVAWATLGETRRAVELYQQRLTIAREIGDPLGEGNALGNLGNAFAALGETRKAIEYYEQHLAIARQIGYRRGEASALWFIALAYEEQTGQERAIEAAMASLEIRRQIEDPNAAQIEAWLRERGVNPE